MQFIAVFLSMEGFTMLKSGSSRVAAAHKYVNAMLNVTYC